MKTMIPFIQIIFFVLVSSCEKEPNINFGFDSPIDINSNGLVITDISRSFERLYLAGFIGLSEGAVEIELLNPIGVAVFSSRLNAPVEVKINETIDALPGYWKLRYESNEGVGEIDLHLSRL